jgi:hypothetical protein
MGKAILRKNKVVIVLQGRFAGRKAVVVKVYDADAKTPFKRALSTLFVALAFSIRCRTARWPATGLSARAHPMGQCERSGATVFVGIRMGV